MISAGTSFSGNISARASTSAISIPLYAGWLRATIVAINLTTT